MSEATPRRRRDSPNGGLTGVLWQHNRQLYAATNHSLAEGRPEVDGRAVLESYDRVEHPYVHGRRPHDIAERIREVLPL